MSYCSFSWKGVHPCDYNPSDVETSKNFCERVVEWEPLSCLFETVPSHEVTHGVTKRDPLQDWDLDWKINFFVGVHKCPIIHSLNYGETRTSIRKRIVLCVVPTGDGSVALPLRRFYGRSCIFVSYVSSFGKPSSVVSGLPRPSHLSSPLSRYRPD